MLSKWVIFDQPGVSCPAELHLRPVGRQLGDRERRSTMGEVAGDSSG